MGNVTIADLTDLTLPMDGTELMEIERAGVSHRVRSGDIAQSLPTAIAVTSSAAGIDLDANGIYYEVTTSGSGGIEYVNIPNFPLDDQSINPRMIGRRITIRLITQTAPADVLVVKLGGVVGVVGVAFAPGSANFGLHAQTTAAGLVLDFEHASVSLVWANGSWLWDYALDGGDSSTQFAPVAVSVTGQAGSDVQIAGASNSAGNGGQLLLSSGQATAGDHNGGDVRVDVGTGSGAGSNGNFLVTGIPTADPHVAGAVWNSAGTLKISAG